MKYSGKNVLILGGTGFIGSRLAERLRLEEGANVRVLVHHWQNAVWVCRGDIELLEGDIGSEESLVNALKGIDLVFDCIGVGGNRETTSRVNIAGTRNLFSILSKLDRKIPIIYLSSIAVLGPRPRSNADSGAGYVYYKSNDYALSKIEAEKIVKQYSQKYSLPCAIIRPTYVWGPNSPSFTLGPIKLMRENRFVLVNEGKGIANAVYIDNLVDALIDAGVNPAVLNKTIIITDGTGYTWEEFFEYYAGFLNVKLNTIYYRVKGHRWSSSAAGYFLANKAVSIIDDVLRIGEKLLQHDPTIVRRGIRYVLTLLKNKIRGKFIFDEWDLKKFTNDQQIDITRAKNLLNYYPRINLSEGMAITRQWLRLQNYLE
jgi:nucleoside-diphosphate-sugar epimerase